jgi:hypothetical protein
VAVQGHPVQVLYVDNLETMVNEWAKILLDEQLAATLPPSELQARVEHELKVQLKQDPFHLLDRYARATAGTGHPLHESFMRRASDIVLPFVQQDVDVLLARG